MERHPPSLESDAPRPRVPELILEPLEAERHAPAPPARPRRWGRRIVLGLTLAVLMLTVVPVLLLSVVPAFTSSFMLRYQVERLLSDRPLPPLRHTWVAWEQIAPAAKLAVIAAEDQRFDEHFGFDLEAIEKAMEHNRRSRRTRGASTISQQTAKNLFLWPERSWARKGLEVGYTVLIEAAWSKRRVLEVYLNIAEFGPGVYGVEAASQTYFRKPAARLTYHEAALLAAVLPNPKRFKVAAPSAYVQRRAAWIRGQMHQLGPGELERLR